MSELITLFGLGSLTALACGLGAVPVFALGERVEPLQPLLWGLAAGLMTLASVVGLIRPALQEGEPASVALGLAGGIAFLMLTRRAMEGRDVHVGRLHGAGVRRSLLVFVVLLVHSLPEGFAIGTAYASDRVGLGVFVILAIALQNIPEGTSVAIPMRAAGFTAAQQFWAAVATSAPQPFGAVIAFVLVELISGLLPASFAFAGGAMLALVVIELIPQAFTPATWRSASFGFAVGGVLMLALSFVLGA